MTQEDYVSFEVAKLLKEKGFKGDINAYYHIWDNGNKVCSIQEFSRSEAPHLYIPAPTLQMAMKWLRKKNISIEASVVRSHYWVYTIYKILSNKVEESYNDGGFKTYEEAVEAALKYSLENLI